MAETEKILAMWAEDSEIDGDFLDEASKKAASLHPRYLELRTVARLRLKKRERELKVLLKNKWLWYSGKMDREEIDRLGWDHGDPLKGLKVLKGDMNRYYDADPDVQAMQQRIEGDRELVEVLDEIINTLRWRHQTIRNMIEWRKFTMNQP